MDINMKKNIYKMCEIWKNTDFTFLRDYKQENLLKIIIQKMKIYLIKKNIYKEKENDNNNYINDNSNDNNDNYNYNEKLIIIIMKIIIIFNMKMKRK